MGTGRGSEGGWVLYCVGSGEYGEDKMEERESLKSEEGWREGALGGVRSGLCCGA